jgi:predicted YcjX-like family ATPase
MNVILNFFKCEATNVGEEISYRLVQENFQDYLTRQVDNFIDEHFGKLCKNVSLIFSVNQMHSEFQLIFTF